MHNLVRCEMWRKCHGSSNPEASNWCPHWGSHEHGSDPDYPCDTLCFNPEIESQAVLLRCKPE
jgi:hypothetical protein